MANSWLFLSQLLSIVSGLDHYDVRDVANLDLEKYRQTCVDVVNKYRKEAGLPPHVRAKSNEACTQKHAQYDVAHGSHAGFKAHICPGKFATENEAGTHGLGQDPMKHLNEVITKFAKGSGQHHKNQMGPNAKGLSCGFACGEKFCMATQDYSNHFDGMHQNNTLDHYDVRDVANLDLEKYRQTCVDVVNKYRKEAGLAPHVRAKSNEACTQKHAQYDVAHGSHAGFKSHICTGKFATENEAGTHGLGQDPMKHLNEVITKFAKGSGQHHKNQMGPNSKGLSCGFACGEKFCMATQDYSNHFDGMHQNDTPNNIIV